MPPDTSTPAAPITTPPQRSSSGLLVSLLTLLIVAGAGGYAFLYSGLFAPVDGSVSVLVRAADGTGSSVSDLDLASGALTARTDVDPASVSSESMKIFLLADGSYITLGPSGVVKKNDSTGAEQLLIATAVAPLARTPLAVWGDGARVAWVNPADRSVQVFGRTAAGAYTPLYLGTDVLPNSLGFTTDGTVLVIAKIGAESTDFYTIDLAAGTLKRLQPLTGLASIIPSL